MSRDRETEPLPVTAPMLRREMQPVRRLLGGILVSLILILVFGLRGCL